jgi:hypothetical protein
MTMSRLAMVVVDQLEPLGALAVRVLPIGGRGGTESLTVRLPKWLASGIRSGSVRALTSQPSTCSTRQFGRACMRSSRGTQDDGPSHHTGGGPLPSIDVADALLDERRELTGLPRLTRCLENH